MFASLFRRHGLARVSPGVGRGFVGAGRSCNPVSSPRCGVPSGNARAELGCPKHVQMARERRVHTSFSRCSPRVVSLHLLLLEWGREGFRCVDGIRPARPMEPLPRQRRGRKERPVESSSPRAVVSETGSLVLGICVLSSQTRQSALSAFRPTGVHFHLGGSLEGQSNPPD